LTVEPFVHSTIAVIVCVVVEDFIGTGVHIVTGVVTVCVVIDPRIGDHRRAELFRYFGVSKAIAIGIFEQSLFERVKGLIDDPITVIVDAITDFVGIGRNGVVVVVTVSIFDGHPIAVGIRSGRALATIFITVFVTAFVTPTVAVQSIQRDAIGIFVINIGFVLVAVQISGTIVGVPVTGVPVIGRASSVTKTTFVSAHVAVCVIAVIAHVAVCVIAIDVVSLLGVLSTAYLCARTAIVIAVKQSVGVVIGIVTAVTGPGALNPQVIV
jgi:hypothetical protein